MAKKKQRSKAVKAAKPLRYKQMMVELLFTDGGMETATFYTLEECFGYINRTVCIMPTVSGLNYSETKKVGYKLKKD